MKRQLTYILWIYREAEFTVARNRYMQTGSDYMHYICAMCAMERARLDYQYAVQCAQQAEDESRRPE